MQKEENVLTGKRIITKLRRITKVRRKSVCFSRKTKEKRCPCKLYKSSTKNKPFFNKNQLYTVSKRVKASKDTLYCWLYKKVKTV